MGDHEQLPKSNGLMLNGLRPDEAFAVTKILDAERWSLVEERTNDLILRIRPNKPSVDRRIAVAKYVQRLIAKCFPCEVFTFGSVPLKTYLPDGDIDLTVFSKNLELKDTWANDVREILEHEEKNTNAEFKVKEVQYIKAEVKIIKCLVENIVVDISFNQLGGLCTLCFLEQIDHLINQDHLFKRSIILIKAWCYYESRILGAHHGLLSTYALETLVLYIFHIYNNSFAGPLEVLFRFLEFFSKFDWENFCISLWGPVPIGSPDSTAEPPRKDSGDLLLSRTFLDQCSAVYAVLPPGNDTQGQPFVSKHFNVIDPLRINNNLGRSVSKGNFYRICSALAFGAKRLMGLLDCPKEDIVVEVDRFFTNTWRRHGTGKRPDAPVSSLSSESQPLNSHSNHDLESSLRQENTRKKTENAGLQAGHQLSMNVLAPFSEKSSQRVVTNNQFFPDIGRTTSPSGSLSQKSHNCQTNYSIPDHVAKNINSSEAAGKERFKSYAKPGFSNDNSVHGKLQFARTHSSPELSDPSVENLSRVRRNIAPDLGKNHFTPGKPNLNYPKTYLSDVVVGRNAKLVNDTSSAKFSSSRQNRSPNSESNCILNSFDDDTGFSNAGEEPASVSESLEMCHEERGSFNMLASPRANGLLPQFHFPINFGPHQFPIPPHILPSISYSQKNLGIIPATLPFSPWATQFPHGFAAPSLSGYLSAAQLGISSEEVMESGTDTSSITGVNQEDADHGFWPEQDIVSSAGVIPQDLNYQSIQTYTSNEMNVSQVGDPTVPFLRDDIIIAREGIGMERISHDDRTMHQNITENDMYSTNRSADTRSLHFTSGSSSRNLITDSLDAKAPKLPGDRPGRKPVASTASTVSYGSRQSWRNSEDGDSEWIKQTSSGNDLTELGDSLSPVSRSHHSVFDPALVSGSDGVFPFPPGFLYGGPRPRPVSASGSVFYPTGPPVPIYMFPVLKLHSESGPSDGILEQVNRLDINRLRPLVTGVELNEKSEQYEESVSTSIMDGVSSESPVCCKSDILNGDFCSHWYNLQYGRLCQDPTVSGPPMYPGPLVVPSVYFQGHHPLDAPGRPFIANANPLPIMSPSPRILPFMPLQPGFVRNAELLPQYGDEVPSFRGGTGTFLPKPKVPPRDRPSSARNHRANYNSDYNSQGDREGSWISAKSRAPNHSHGRAQHDKPSTRPDRSPVIDYRADRSREAQKNERVVPNQHNSLSSNHGPVSMTYGMHPLTSTSSDNVHPSGTLVMFYPYIHPSLGFGSSSEQVEHGSFESMRFPSMNVVQPPCNGGVPRNAFEPAHETYQQGSECSSPDQPSSPHIRRSAVGRNYQLNEEDFPPL